MLKVVFYYVLSLSLAGTAAALGILLVKTIFRRKLPASLQYYIWIAAMLLFLLPIRQFIPLTAIAFPYAFNAQPLQPDIVQPIEPAQNVLYHQANNALAPESRYEFPFYLLWAAGMLCYFLIKSVRYFTLKSRLIKNSFVCNNTMGKALAEAKERTGYQKKIQLHCCPLLHSPIAIGVMRPIILLPEIDNESEQLEMILIHELTHLKRHDLLFKLAAMVVTGIHWFNPVCYLMLKDINDCCELNCDRLVVRQMEQEKKKRYCKLLIDTAYSPYASFAEPSTSLGSKTKLIKRRVYSIMDKTHNRLSTVITTLIVASVSLLAVACSPAITTEEIVSETSEIIKDTSSAAAASDSAKDISSMEPTSDELSSSENVNDTRLYTVGSPAVGDSGDVTLSYSDGTLEKHSLMWPLVVDAPIVVGFEDYKGHTGLDFAPGKGIAIVAVDDGIVIIAEEAEGGYGKYIIIDHGNGVQTLYAHCDSLDVKVGASVKRGDVIATSGDSGATTACHLHFELRVDGEYINPRHYLIPAKK